MWEVMTWMTSGSDVTECRAEENELRAAWSILLSACGSGMCFYSSSRQTYSSDSSQRSLHLCHLCRQRLILPRAPLPSIRFFEYALVPARFASLRVSDCRRLGITLQGPFMPVLSSWIQRILILRQLRCERCCLDLIGGH